MTTPAKRPATHKAAPAATSKPAPQPKPRTIEDVQAELAAKLDQLNQERMLFRRLVTIAQGRIDEALQAIIYDRIRQDERHYRELAADEVRSIMQQMEP